MRQATTVEAEGGGSFLVRPMLILCAAQLIFVAAFQMVSIALPDIQADFDVGESALQWVNSALALALAATILPAGRLVDGLGGKVIFQVGAAELLLTNLAPLPCRPSPSQNRAERTNAGRPVGHPAR